MVASKNKRTFIGKMSFEVKVVSKEKIHAHGHLLTGDWLPTNVDEDAINIEWANWTPDDDVPENLMELSAVESEAAHLCTTCQKTFSSKGNLNRHVREKHKNIRRYTCPFCGLGFKQEAHRSNHLFKIHI